MVVCRRRELFVAPAVSLMLLWLCVGDGIVRSPRRVPDVVMVVCRRRELFVAPAVSLLNNNRAEFDTSKVSKKYRAPSCPEILLI